MKKSGLVKMERSDLELLSHILGPSSAAALALADADSHDGPVNFYLHGTTWVVEKLPKDDTARRL